MKKHRLVFAKKNEDTFHAIKTGKKKIETRAATDKYIIVKRGDILKFACGKSSFEKKVRKIEHFSSLDSLFKKYKPSQINPKFKTKKEAVRKYHSFPNYKQKIKHFGIMAFTL